MQGDSWYEAVFVARMEHSEIRKCVTKTNPDYAVLYPGCLVLQVAVPG